MSARGWRNLSFVLGVVCIVELWRDCTRDEPAPPPAPDCPASVARPAVQTSSSRERGAPADDAAAPRAEAPRDGLSFHGFKVPGWALWFAPHSGEDLRSYRDRMLPLARAAIAPHRARVARSRDNFAALVKLDERQRAELDAAARETADALEERVLGALMNGEFAPSQFKPMAGVTVARELLDIVDRGNRRFVDALRDDQRSALAQHPFDFGDYLVFSTPWEDALKLLD